MHYQLNTKSRKTGSIGYWHTFSQSESRVYTAIFIHFALHMEQHHTSLTEVHKCSSQILATFGQTFLQLLMLCSFQLYF